MQALTGCLYLPVAGPKSEGVAEKATVESLVGDSGVERDLVLAYVWYNLADKSGPEVKQFDWIRDSLTNDQLVSVEHLITTWSAGRCEQDLFSRVQRTQ